MAAILFRCQCADAYDIKRFSIIPREKRHHYLPLRDLRGFHGWIFDSVHRGPAPIYHIISFTNSLWSKDAHRAHIKEYSVVFVGGQVQVHFTHIIQGYSQTPGYSYDCPTADKRPWRIWVNNAHESTQNMSISYVPSSLILDAPTPNT